MTAPTAIDNDARAFRLGVVEGYFGRQWSWDARRQYAGFLAAQGCNSYVYAPKNDIWLRKQWQTPMPQTHLAELQSLSTLYRQANVDFGIGLSPFELYRDFSSAKRALLLAKLDQINAIAPDTLCILFDDMMGNLDNLADVQLEIMDCVRARSSASRFVICPTYYSSDPLLTQHFGAQPEHYLEDLGHGLDADIDIFWTGPKVISTSYPREHLLEIGAKLRRKPLLWDNYPVNDAKRLTRFLHLQAFSGREPELRDLTRGHLANPMNQALLSQIPLHSLAALYRDMDYDPGHAFVEACAALCSAPLAAALLEDAPAFAQDGLDAFTTLQKKALLEKYTALEHPLAQEVSAWLRGEYAFDPACLT